MMGDLSAGKAGVYLLFGVQPILQFTARNETAPLRVVVGRQFDHMAPLLPPRYRRPPGVRLVTTERHQPRACVVRPLGPAPILLEAVRILWCRIIASCVHVLLLPCMME